MAFVDVPDRRLEPSSRERAHAADAEHDLLLDARRAVAAVQPMGDVAIVLGVLRDVGIEQIQA